jgi:hypothetical protein
MTHLCVNTNGSLPTDSKRVDLDKELDGGVEGFLQLLRSNKVVLRASVYCCNLIYRHRRYAEIGGDAMRSIDADEIENIKPLKEVLAGGLRAMKQSQTPITTFNMCVLDERGNPIWNEYDRFVNREFWNAYKPMYGDRASFFIRYDLVDNRPTITLGEWSE